MVHPTDKYVGNRLRERRKMLGISQEDLGKRLKKQITFQQIQKYERGANRISSSYLWEFSQILGIKIDYFFEGLGEKEITANMGDERETLQLVRNYTQVKDPILRKKIFHFIEELGKK